MLKYSILFVLIAVGHCDVVGNVGDFFTKKFTDFKTLFANDEKDLQTNVGKVSNLLSTVQNKMGLLKPLADESQKSVLEKVGDMITQVNGYKNILSNVNIDFSKKKTDWEELVKNIFVTQGLNKILPLLAKVNNGASSTCAATAFISLLIPLTAFYRQ